MRIDKNTLLELRWNYTRTLKSERIFMKKENTYGSSLHLLMLLHLLTFDMNLYSETTILYFWKQLCYFYIFSFVYLFVIIM